MRRLFAAVLIAVFGIFTASADAQVFVPPSTLTLGGLYGASSGQSASTSSFVGNALWNGTTVDAWRGGPAGTAVSNGTAGIPYIQGIGTAGAVPVTGTFYQSTQPVSGTLTVNAGTGFPSSGTSGTPSSNVLSIQGVSGGTAVPVSGTVSSSGLWPISGSNTALFAQDSANNLLTNVAGSLGTYTWTGNTSVTIPLQGYGGVGFQIVGASWTAGTIAITHDDGAGVFTASQPCLSSSGSSSNIAYNGSTDFTCQTAPYSAIKLTMSGFTGTSATIYWHVTNPAQTTGITGSGGQSINNGKPDGAVSSQTGSLYVTNFNELQGTGSSAWRGEVGCDQSAVINNVTSAGTTSLATGATGGKSIYVCGISITGLGASTTVQFASGAAESCSSPVAITGQYLQTNSYGNGVGTILAPLPQNANLCMTVTGTGGVNGVVTYAGPF